MNHLHVFLDPPARTSNITAADAVTARATTVERSSQSSPTSDTPKSIAASHLLTALSAWASSCAQVRSAHSNMSREKPQTRWTISGDER